MDKNLKTLKSERPQTSMDRIFDHPVLYRLKIGLVKLVIYPISKFLIREPIDPDAVALACVQPGDRVFEVGCGDGNLYRLLRDHGRADNFVGSDYNEHMVRYCAQHYPGAKWEVYSGGRYDHPDASFDWCVIRNVLHHIPAADDIVLTLSEAARIASTVLLIEPLQSDAPLLAWLKHHYWAITDGGVNYFNLHQMRELFDRFPSKIHDERYTRPLRQVYSCRYSRGERAPEAARSHG
jgi:2-polyprenyl-3-methyl-5-hydroxy-6-metoxy-1,4-benzoquinol methylase